MWNISAHKQQQQTVQTDHLSSINTVQPYNEELRITLKSFANTKQRHLRLEVSKLAVIAFTKVIKTNNKSQQHTAGKIVTATDLSAAFPCDSFPNLLSIIL